MPRLPDFQSLGQSPVPQPAGGIASYEPSMRHTGAGLQAAGRDLEEASNIVAETNQRQDAMNAEAALNRLQATRLDLEAGAGGFRNVKGQGAVGQTFLDGYQQKFSDAAKDIEGTLGNENQKRLFQQRIPVAALQYKSALLTHQATETDHFNDQTENDTIDLARKQIFAQPTDGNAVGAGLSQINWAIDQKAKRLGWSPEVVAATKSKFTEKVAEDAAALQVERDPLGSLAALNKRLGIAQAPEMTGTLAFDATGPDKLIELHRRAETYVKQADNLAKAEQTKKLKDAEEAFNGLRDFSLTGAMVSPDYQSKVFGLVAGTPYEAAAKELVGASMTGAMHGSQTLPVQEQQLRTLDAAVQRAGSSPEEAKIIQQLRTITNTQKEAYKENPWAASTRFGRQPDVPEAQITDPAQVPQIVASRLPMMTGVETYAGMPVSPLQPGEAKAFVDKMRALPPDTKAEVLGQTGAMLSVPRASALAEQLDKQDKPLALALKMGLDRTSAGRVASSLVLRGDQALKDKTVKKDDSALAGWRAEIATLVRGSLGDERAEQDVIDSAYYVRAALEQDGSAAAGFKSVTASSENALGFVIGLPVERAGVKTFLPRGMKEGAFNDKIGEYTASRLRSMTAPQTSGPLLTHDGFPARKNSDGSHSTEISITVTNPSLNGGKPTNIPSLWRGKELAEDQAVDAALKSGRKFTAFNSIDEAVTAAKARSNAGGAGADAPRNSGVFYVRGQPVTAEQVASRLSSYGLKRDGKGNYVPIVNNAPMTLDAGGMNLLRLGVQ